MNVTDVLSPGEHYAIIRGIKLWYFVRGKGPILVVQPGGAGWGGDASIYIETLKPLEKIRTMVYLEPRGIGHSQRLRDTKAYSMNEYVMDLEAIRQYFSLPRLSITGHSHGGFVALKYALQYPKFVGKLLLLDTTPCVRLGNYFSWFSARKGSKKAMSLLQELPQNKNLTADELERATLQILLPVIHFYNYSNVSPQISDLLSNMIVSAEPHHYFSNNEMNNYDLRKTIHKITASTLIILGEDEMPHVFLGSKLLAERLPNSQLIIIEKSGHWPMIEAPKSFFDAVIPFLVE
ncbi:MAG: alpha/beta fold hydrolase [Candidatus Hodarchaeales archaeon]|jgi:proline iminopeptidase